MTGSIEQQHYETAHLWRSETYLKNEAEQQRYRTCSDMIAPDVRSLLDVGTGNGAFLRFLEDQQSAIETIGLERSEVARQMAVCASEIRSGSADSLPFEDGAFDLVSALEVIEHLPYGVYEAALRELERVARTYILISVPYREKRIKVYCPQCTCAFDPHYHMRTFDEATLARLFGAFEPAQMVKVSVSDFLLSKTAERMYQRIFKNIFPPTAHCPQCGYSRPQQTTSVKAASERERVLRNLTKAVLPKTKSVRWVVVRYQRRNSAG